MSAIVRVQEQMDEVVCTGTRLWLRARRTPHGLTVDLCPDRDGRWERIDEDLHRLYRAGLRLVALDRSAASQLASAVSDLTGVPRVDADPARQLVRAVWPLLAGTPGLPLPAVPARLPGWMAPAFRERSPRAAAGWLYRDRSTRPVVRGLCRRLSDDPPDLFGLSVAVAASRHLPPDHVARILEVAPPAGADRGPLTPDELSGLADLVADEHPRRAVAWLARGLDQAGARDRLRFVAAARVPAGPTLRDAGSWEALARDVALTAVAP